MLMTDLGERAIIRNYLLPLSRPHLGAFVQDDCAVIRQPQDLPLLLSIDQGPSKTFTEMLGIGDLEDVGHFLVTINVSDIAAMGGTPLGLVLAMAIRGDETTDSLEELLRGISAACEEYRTPIMGGDTKEGHARNISIAILGYAHPKAILGRRGTTVGDLVYISGPLGVILRNYVLTARQKRDAKTVQSISRPKAKLSFGQALASSGYCTSCMDMSDGLLSTAHELSEINSVQFNIDIERVPVAESPRHDLSRSSWWNTVLNVGGDFELMFTVSPQGQRFAESIGGHRVGIVVSPSEQPGIAIKPLREMGLQFTPWEHFRSNRRIEEVIETWV